MYRSRDAFRNTGMPIPRCLAPGTRLYNARIAILLKRVAAPLSRHFATSLSFPCPSFSGDKRRFKRAIKRS